MIGAIIGDVVGSRFEFSNKKSKEFNLVNDWSKFTDDSVMTFAVLDWCLHAEKTSILEAAKYLQKWGRKYPYAGYGGIFRNYLLKDNPTPYGSYGNGSAMRCSAIGWFADSIETIKEWNKIITGCTHNHPEGMKGAEVVATMIFKARHGASKEELKEYAYEMYPSIKDLSYEDLVDTYTFNATCQGSIPQALYCFLISNDFIDCLRTSISIGGDSDTIAAIVCSIAEAFYKEIPVELVDNVKSKLSNEMLELLKEAEEKLTVMGEKTPIKVDTIKK